MRTFFVLSALIVFTVLSCREITPEPVSWAEGEKERLSSRIETASSIVAGKVSRISPLTVDPQQFSEHDPEWQLLIIDVDITLKSGGDVPIKKSIAAFPASMDVMWHQAPKFVVGQEGIWLFSWKRYPNYTRDILLQVALDPMDFQPLENLEKIKIILDEDKPQ